MSRSLVRYQSCKDPRTPLRMRLKELAKTRVRFGYRRLHVMLRREGWKVNHKVIYRLCREEGLLLRQRGRKRRKMAVLRQARCHPVKKNEAWSLDFVSDQLSNGARFRALTVVDVFSREALAIDVGPRLRGEHVVATLNRIVQQRGSTSISVHG